MLRLGSCKVPLLCCPVALSCPQSPEKVGKCSCLYRQQLSGLEMLPNPCAPRLCPKSKCGKGCCLSVPLQSAAFQFSLRLSFLRKGRCLLAVLPGRSAPQGFSRPLSFRLQCGPVLPLPPKDCPPYSLCMPYLPRTPSKAVKKRLCLFVLVFVLFSV